MARWYVVVPVVVVCLGVVCSGGRRTKAWDGCQDAMQHLIKHGIGKSDIEHHLPGNGTSACGGGACCIPELGDALVTHARRQLHSAVRRSAANLYSTVAASRDAFQRTVEEALMLSEHRTMKVFRASFPRLADEARAILNTLFASFRVSLLDTDEAALEVGLASFWDDLFPLVYHSGVHSRLPPFSSRFAECLRESRRTIRPWGVLPALIGEPLIRGLETARLMIYALSMGADVVSTVQDFEIPTECGEPAARLQFCGACHGALVPPCSGLCLNVARGCFAPLAEVDGAWTDLAGAVDRVDESLRALQLGYLLLHSLPERLSEAVMIAMENGPKLQKKVRRECGPPTHEGEALYHQYAHYGMAEHTASVSERESDSHSVGTQETTESHLSLDPIESTEGPGHHVLQEAGVAVRVLQSSQGWWSGIADAVCRELGATDDGCWNGARVATYIRPAAGIGVSAQKYNPEVRVARPDTSVYALADQLRAVKRMVTSRLTWLPEPQSYRQTDTVFEGSGARIQDEDSLRRRTYSDDEDDGFGSGSGDYSLDEIFSPGSKDNDKLATQASPGVLSNNWITTVTSLMCLVIATNIQNM